MLPPRFVSQKYIRVSGGLVEIDSGFMHIEPCLGSSYYSSHVVGFDLNTAKQRDMSRAMSMMPTPIHTPKD